MFSGIKKIGSTPGTTPVKPIYKPDTVGEYHGSKNPMAKDHQRKMNSFSDVFEEEKHKFDAKA